MAIPEAIPPWLVHFSLNLSHLLNVKHWQYSHWNVLVMDICIVRINQNSECCSAEFWQVRRIGLSWNFTGFQWINLNDSFRREKRCWKNSLESFQRYTKKRYKSKFWMSLHLDRWWENGLVLSWQERKYTKFPSIEIWY